MAIAYRADARPDAALIAALYRASPLYRPVDDQARIAAMYAGSNLVLTAWDEGRLVGILRGWTDGAYDGYVCDLAVLPDYQKQGVGRRLLELCTERDPRIQWVLRASKLASDYYRHLGWEKIENGWEWKRAPWPGMPS
jgi:ribosomal protein S18 acetylase RimI-like enzyme